MVRTLKDACGLFPQASFFFSFASFGLQLARDLIRIPDGRHDIAHMA